jgi:hypothetical protein
MKLPECATELAHSDDRCLTWQNRSADYFKPIILSRPQFDFVHAYTAERNRDSLQLSR